MLFHFHPPTIAHCPKALYHRIAYAYILQTDFTILPYGSEGACALSIKTRLFENKPGIVSFNCGENNMILQAE